MKQVSTTTDPYRLLKEKTKSKQNQCETWRNPGKEAKQLTFTPGLTKW